jgi:hypothetical protein
MNYRKRARSEEESWQEERYLLEGRIWSLEEAARAREAVSESRDRVLAVMEEALQCPVCLEVPRGAPVLNCPNGHIFCASCSTAACPVCR